MWLSRASESLLGFLSVVRGAPFPEAAPGRKT